MGFTHRGHRGLRSSKSLIVPRISMQNWSPAELEYFQKPVAAAFEQCLAVAEPMGFNPLFASEWKDMMKVTSNRYCLRLTCITDSFLGIPSTFQPSRRAFEFISGSR